MSAVKPSGLVTLLTDFGTSDPFVGILHGVLLARSSDLRIVDLTHGIAAQDTMAAAFWLERSYRSFPEGTVHVAIVDPGVGSDRRALVAEANRHYFVGPDNGVLGAVFERASDPEVRRIDQARLGITRPSRTFHGRDIFAPAAAELAAARLWLSELGPTVESWVLSPVPRPIVSPDRVTGVIITFDRYGNAISNIAARDVAGWPAATVHVASQTLLFSGTYSEAPPRQPLAVINAFNRVEIACRDASARELLALQRGGEVRIERT